METLESFFKDGDISSRKRNIFTVIAEPKTDNNGLIKLFLDLDFGLPDMEFLFENSETKEKCNLACISKIGEVSGGFEYSAKFISDNPDEKFDTSKFGKIGENVGWSYSYKMKL